MKRKRTKLAQVESLSTHKAHDLAALSLSPDTFETVYHTIIGLRFPMDVAQVLELRYLVNHAVDEFQDPPPTPDYREFRDALQNAIDAFGIDNKRHSDRLLRILTMMRELHYGYSIRNRDEETSLRDRIAKNRQKRRRSTHMGLFFTLTAIIGGFLWVGLPDAGWSIKIFTAAAVYLAWDFLHSLPRIDRELEALDRQVSDLLRRRVKSIHWRALIHKLALVLGYKRISGIEVFRIENEYEQPGRTRLHH